MYHVWNFHSYPEIRKFNHIFDKKLGWAIYFLAFLITGSKPLSSFCKLLLVLMKRNEQYMTGADNLLCTTKSAFT